ncbi:hypothetical protein QYE76_063483 [Lolium multiflorum]|uniref:SAP domain-containing protein n=1 Tax=Lolium multiflorum TaxID=4521 RepID=A0AAD8W722_LOLMU|nr:hypothetical protein QYE76_063483 [Lolium multiflorum]
MAAEGSSGSSGGGGGGGGRKTPSPHKARERGAAKFLAGLPSRGNFSSSSISSNLGGLRVYVCEHDTNPPDKHRNVVDKPTKICSVTRHPAKAKEADVAIWHRPLLSLKASKEVFFLDSPRCEYPCPFALKDATVRKGQVIETDTTNILIRHLQLKKKESEAKDTGSRTPGESSKGKRSAARSLDVQNSSKKPNLGSSSGLPSSEEAISGFSQHTLQSFTVERLRALLRQRGFTTKGKKDELITRLRESQS